MAALCFKTIADPNGDLTFLRVYSGSLTVGDSLLNTSHGKSERIGRLYRMHAGSKEKIAEAYAGDIIAVMGLKNVHTGDTLWETRLPTSIQGFPITFAVDGKQYLAVPTGVGGASWGGMLPADLTPEVKRPVGGNGLFVFALPD